MTIFASSPKRSLVTLAISILMIPGALVAQTDHSVDALKKIANSKNYILVSPAENWAYPGGLLFAKKGSTTATFVDLPSHFAKPSAQDATIDFPAIKAKTSFSITAVLTGLASLIGVLKRFGGSGLECNRESVTRFKAWRLRT